MNNRKGALLGFGVVAGLSASIAGIATLSGRATGEDIGCELTKLGPVDGAGGVRAVCRWPIPATRLQQLLDRLDRHARYFSALAASDVLGHEGDTTRVRQVHRAKGMSDREIVVDWKLSPLSGGKRYAWTKSSDQTGLSGEMVEVEVHTGRWEITGDATQAGVFYESRYLPGGRIPGFLVRWFQDDGVVDVLADLRNAAEAG